MEDEYIPSHDFRQTFQKWSFAKKSSLIEIMLHQGNQISYYQHSEPFRASEARKENSKWIIETSIRRTLDMSTNFIIPRSIKLELRLYLPNESINVTRKTLIIQRLAPYSRLSLVAIFDDEPFDFDLKCDLYCLKNYEHIRSIEHPSHIYTSGIVYSSGLATGFDKYKIYSQTIELVKEILPLPVFEEIIPELVF